MDRTVLTVFSICVGAAAGLFAQQPGSGGEERGVFFEALDVHVVNIEVYVTDKTGNPVTGLDRDDFQLYEDGRPVAITNFYAVAPQEPPPAPPEDRQRAEPSQAREAPPREAQAPPPEEQRLFLVVYIDNFNILPHHRKRVIGQLRNFLTEHLDPDDRVMLVSYDRSLHTRHPFTGDPERIVSALHELELVSGHGVHTESDRRDLLDAIDQAEDISAVAWRIREFAQSRWNDLSFTIDALKEVTTSLSGLAGRKALVYVSDGLPMVPAEDLFYALQQKFQDTTLLIRAQEYNLLRRFQELAAEANANRVAFYTIDAGGLRVYSSASVTRADPGQPGSTSMVDSVRFSNLQAPLILLAEATGGRAIYNTNDVGPDLEKVAADFGAYYSLGYTPSHGGTGRYYRVEVEVEGKGKGKGLTVRHREGYRDKPLPTRMADAALTHLMYGFERNPHGVGLRLTGSRPGDDGNYEVGLLVEIPLGTIVLVPRGELHEARLQLFFAAMDDSGELAEVQQVEVPISIPAADVGRAHEQLYAFPANLTMHAGGHRVVVGLWDQLGSSGSFVTRQLSVGG